MARVTTTLLALVVTAAPAYADPAPTAGVSSTALRQSIRSVRFDAAPRAVHRQTKTVLMGAPGRHLTRRGLQTALAAIAGLYAGGYLGASIEGDRCRCDDPGLKGFLIGAPIGAVSAGIGMWILSGR